MKSISEVDDLRWLAKQFETNPPQYSSQLSALIYKYAFAGANKIERLHNYITDYREEFFDLQEDFRYIRELLPMDADFCGGFCNTETLVNILTGDESISQTIIDYLKWAYSQHKESIPVDCKRCKEIAQTYGIDCDIAWTV